MQRQRPIRAGLEVLVLGAERVAVQLVGVKEMMMVVERQRPEPADRWERALVKGHGVGSGAVETLSVGVEVLVEVGRLSRGVDEDVGLPHRRPRQVVGSERSPVSLGAPIVRDRDADVSELEQLLHEPVVGSDRPSLSTSGETLTIEELMTLRARTENAGHGRRARMELERRLRLLPPAAKTSEA